MPSLFSTPKTPSIPTPPPVAPMPDPQNQDLDKRRALAAAAASSGRASTFLSPTGASSQKLGG